MRVLLVYCHPVRGSHAAALKDRLRGALERAGHELDLMDLYAEGFQPVMSEAERRAYEEPGRDLGDIQAHVDRLVRAEGLLLVYPTWWYGMPAMLKGWFDRVWLPGTAIDIVPGKGIVRSRLAHIGRLAVATTYGSPAWYIRMLVGDPGRKVVERGLRRMLAPACRCSGNAFYGIDQAAPAELARFGERTERRVTAFFGPGEQT